jgi:hypothetical protein
MRGAFFLRLALKRFVVKLLLRSKHGRRALARFASALIS